MKSTFASLQFRAFRLWFVGALVCNVGTWMQRVAQDWLVLTQLTNNSGIAVGITTALQFGPTLVVTPLAGVVADRARRRTVLLVTQTSIGVLAAALGALVLSGHVQLWQVYVAATLLGVVSAFDAPVRQTFVAEMVPPERLSNAVSLNSASFNAARLIGPAVAGLTIAAIGTGWVFVVNAVSMAGTVGALLAMRPRDLRQVPSAPRAKGQLREGLRYVRHRGDILVIMAVIGVASTFALNFQLTSATMARIEFGKDAGQYGLLGSVLAIGSLTGALLAARREHPRVRLVIGATFGLGVAMGVQALMPTYMSYAVMCIPVGLASLTMLTAANSAIQVSTPPQVRGRVMALYMMVMMGATPIGSPLVGWIGEQWGPRWSIGIGGLAAVGVAVGAAVWARHSWRVEVSYQRHGRPHLLIRHPGELADEPAVPETASVRTAA